MQDICNYMMHHAPQKHLFPKIISAFQILVEDAWSVDQWKGHNKNA
jgi:hypothetical protein